MSERRTFGLALGAMMAVQMLTAMLQQSVPVMAPVAAPALGLAKQDVGYYTALTFLGANFSAVAGGIMAARWVRCAPARWRSAPADWRSCCSVRPGCR